MNQPVHHRGRGALSNASSRFQNLATVLDDGVEGPSPITECRGVDAASIIARNQSPDVPFEQSINPYQGCEHGCVYCYARPTHVYLDLSPGLDFETRLVYKRNAAAQLRLELARPSYRCRSITIGGNTDPYQPVEATLGITRQCLEVLLEHRHPVSLITKGSLITRDIDILAELATQGLASVAISLTSLDNTLKRSLEPRAAAASARLSVIRELSRAGVPVTVLVAPVIPALNDAELESILEAAANAGASRAAFILLRLPLEVEELFSEWLHAHYPERARHVLSLVRQCRGGALNDSRFGHRMRGEGTFASLLSQRFRLSCRKLGLNMADAPDLRTDLFRVPGAAEQIDLFT